MAAQLGEFRRSLVLAPLSEDGAPLSVELNGLRWLIAFSDKAAMARWAAQQDEQPHEWNVAQILGVRLLDAVVPRITAPCGVALNVGSPGRGALFPPVKGTVPEGAAVDGVAIEGRVTTGPSPRPSD